jgi:hypothetical protein
LSELAGNRAIPEECLFCPQVVKCIVNLWKQILIHDTN